MTWRYFQRKLKANNLTPITCLVCKHETKMKVVCVILPINSKARKFGFVLKQTRKHERVLRTIQRVHVTGATVNSNLNR